ncbi:MAG: alpha/beta fold hydrolase, partial [Edaphobacter sp.]
MHRLFAALILLTTSAIALPKPAATGTIPTPDVDLYYETFGAANSATPIIVANGGPGLSHVYMLQSDTWPRIAHT